MTKDDDGERIGSIDEHGNVKLTAPLADGLIIPGRAKAPPMIQTYGKVTVETTGISIADFVCRGTLDDLRILALQWAIQHLQKSLALALSEYERDHPQGPTQ